MRDWKDVVWMFALALSIMWGVWNIVGWAHRNDLGDGWSAPATPATVPHVASDCRAVCTLEGMALVGVEIAAQDQQVTVGPRCLCAPVSP